MVNTDCVSSLDCKILTTERLVLRQPHKDDAEDMAILANNFEIAKNLSRLPYPYFDADAKEFLQRIENKEEPGCAFAITSAETGVLMGLCGLHDANHVHEYPFMGYWLGEQYWGNGYATEAARALIDLFFKTTTGPMMMASCMADNSASKAVITKCGGQYWKSAEVYSKVLNANQKIDKFRISRDSWMAALAA